MKSLGRATGTFIGRNARRAALATGRGARDATTATVGWLPTEGGRTLMYSTLPPLAVTGMANLAAHQLYTPAAGLSAALIALSSGFMGVRGLAHKWHPGAVYAFLGVSATTIDLSVMVACGGWADVFAGLFFAAAGLGGRIAYLGSTVEKRAKADTERAKAEALDAKTVQAEHKMKMDEITVRSKARLAELKAESEQYSIRLKMAKLAEANAPEYQPNLTGHTPEETALRTAFWDVYEAELVTCFTQDTQTGYTATLSLPTGLNRDAVRTGWDKVSSAMRADGRFILGNGRFTNELSVKFLDNGMKSPVDVTWNLGHMSQDPGMMSIGINTETGEPVLIHADERTMICGASGTGKSWASRPMMAHAHIHGDLVLIDGKGEEATIWGDVARVAIETDDILALVDEIHREMNARKHLMRSRKISVWDGSQLTAVIDEGQVVLALIASDKENAAKRMQKLRELSSLGRSRGVVLWWATQKPVMSGPAPGIDNLIAPNMLQRFSLRVADEQEARTALDDCAYYGPNLIPDHRDMRGHGYLKGFGPSLIRAWTMDDAAVRSLEPKMWSGPEVPVEGSGASNEDKVIRFFTENPFVSGREAAKMLGVDEKTVRKYRQQHGI